MYVIEVPDGYEELGGVLQSALLQAADGKGKERHASPEQRFIEQPIMTLQAMFGQGFALGQAAKKMQESTRMEVIPAERELLGAINYIAAAILYRYQEAK